MTVEELYQKREEFSSRVQEVVGTELGNMGLEVKNFTITDISDENGYIKALGEGMIAQRKKDAEIQKRTDYIIFGCRLCNIDLFILVVSIYLQLTQRLLINY